MKTFKEFCEQVTTSPFANKPEHPIKGFARQVVGSIQNRVQNKFNSIRDTVNDLGLAAGIHTDPKVNYMARDYATRQAKMRLRGINVENPSGMPINKSEPEGAIRYAYPQSPYRPKGFGGKPTTEV